MTKRVFKKHLTISDPEQFIKRGEGLSLYDYPTGVPGWIDLGEIQFEVDINMDDVYKAAGEELDEKEERLMGQVEKIRQRKAELLSLTYTPTPE